MMKEIKIKHYLNKRLKPEIENGIKHYPVYFRFNLDGKNHRIPSFFIKDYLASEEELNSLTLEMQEEEYFINLLYRSDNNYEFKFYHMDVQQIALSLKDILQNYMMTGDGNDIHPDYLYSLSSYMEDYKNSFIEFIAKSHNYSIEFTKSFFRMFPSDEHDFYPVDFIKNPETKEFFEAYNHVMEFSKERLIHEYDWIQRKKSEVFKKEFGEKSYQIVNKLVHERLKVQVL